MTPKYRPDIDGLRAIAVMSVLFFHAGIDFFSGGYVGVDIFFVISGYLITMIIVRELEHDEFSIVKFYERRFRRILPALTVIVVISFVVGSVLLSPSGLFELGRSVVATSIFSSNILFYQDYGYFDGPSEFKPLLHTWSLAVEEQYYIFFPILMIMISKFGFKSYSKWLIFLGLLSFVACIIKMEDDPSAAFYLIQNRAWELLAGSILAVGALPNPKKKYVREMLSTIGIMLIGYSVFYYTPYTNFPGVAAVIPTIGAAMIIYAGIGGKSVVGNILSIRPVVFIGLISYSLYLWHWPVIVFTKYYSIIELSNIQISVMLIVIFILSIFSWHYIEKPFRKKNLFSSRKSLFVTSSSTLIIILSLGFFLVVKDGLPNRYDNLGDKIGAVDPTWNHWAGCERVEKKFRRNQELCDIGKDEGEISFILWGDSHAMALAAAVDMSATSLGVKGKIATEPACPPLLSIDRVNKFSCHKFNETVLKYISETSEIQTVVLAARWALSTNGTRYKQEVGKPFQLVDVRSPNDVDMSNLNLFEAGLRRTVNKLRDMGKTVILVKPVPEVGFDVPSAYFVSEITGRDVNSMVSPTFSEYLQRTNGVASIFSEIEKEKLAHIIDPSVLICDQDYCQVMVDGFALYLDDDHLSTFGSRYLASVFNAEFKKISDKTL